MFGFKVPGNYSTGFLAALVTLSTLQLNWLEGQLDIWNCDNLFSLLACYCPFLGTRTVNRRKAMRVNLSQECHKQGSLSEEGLDMQRADYKIRWPGKVGRRN